MQPIWRAALVVAMAMTALPLVAPAQLRPAGPEFELAWSGSITTWRVAPYAYGDFLVLQGGGGWTHPIEVQRYDHVGRPRGAPILIAPPAVDPILATAFAVAPSGEYLVAWEQSDMGFCRQWYVLVGPDDMELAWGTLDQWYPCGRAVVAAAGNGDFVLAHERLRGFDMRVHDRTGALITPPFVVSDAGRSPSVVADRDGNFWVTWSEENADPHSFITLSRRFDRWGHALTGLVRGSIASDACVSGDMVSRRFIDEQGTLKVEFRHPDGTSFLDYKVALGAPTDYLWVTASCDAANNLVIVFDIYDYITNRGDSYAVRFRADGTRDGPIFRVSSLPPDGHVSCGAVTGDPSGNVLIAWESSLGPRARVFRIPPKGDFDGDLGADLVLRDEETGATRLWMMDDGVRNGNVMVWPETPGPDWRLVGVDDFDGDRRQDLVFQNDATGAVELELLSGPDGNEVVGAAPLAGTPGPDWELSATGDFSHDGWPDLLWRHRTTQQLAVWTLQRSVHTGTLVPNPDHADSPDWSVVSAADWNGDGMRDLLWYNRATDRLVQWLLDGNLVRLEGRFTNPPAAADANWKVVAAADFGVGPGGVAGTPDVVWRNEASGYQVIWYFDFEGNRTAGIYTTPSAPNAGWRAAGPR